MNTLTYSALTPISSSWPRGLPLVDISLLTHTFLLPTLTELIFQTQREPPDNLKSKGPQSMWSSQPSTLSGLRYNRITSFVVDPDKNLSLNDFCRCFVPFLMDWLLVTRRGRLKFYTNPVQILDSEMACVPG